MKAAVYYENGPPSVLRYEDVADPAPGPGEVLVAVEAISIEGGDLTCRRRQVLPARPHICGYQAAGQVVATGSGARRFQPGDRVATFAMAGSHAALRVVPEDLAWRVPDGLEIGVASTVPVTFGTADDALFDFGGLQAGETVLIQGAAGGVGLAAVQMAHAAGARVIATASSAERLARLADLGADHGLDYRTADLAAMARALTDGRGVDLVLDMAGGQAFDALVAATAYRGRLVTVGASSGQPASVKLMDLLVDARTLRGFMFGREMHTERAREIIERRLAEVAAGRFTMPIDRVFPLAEAAAAHAYAETAHPFGRVVMTP